MSVASLTPTENDAVVDPSSVLPAPFPNVTVEPSPWNLSIVIVFCLVNSKKSLEFLEENYEDVKHSSNNRQHTRFNFQDIDNDEDESNPVNCVSQ